MGDAGNPADWPAAQPKPPSLAGAYSDNMMTVLITLIRYEDWVWSHPNPSLVGSYMLPGGNAYRPEFASISRLTREHWRADPSPTEIDWLKVIVPPKRLRLISGKLVVAAGRPAYAPARVYAVLNQKVGHYLNSAGEIVSRSPGGGKRPYTVMLSQGADARWRIIDIRTLHLRDGLKGLIT